MPSFFRFSKNGRKDTPQNRNRKYAEPNNSTMNRICKAFDDIGNINMNYAGIPQFNWQMFLSEPCMKSRPEIPEMFCEMDNANISSVIESQDSPYSNERLLINGCVLVAEDIVEKMTEKFGSLEACYPYVLKYLFAGEGVNKSAHKQMFWRIFGDIALKNLKKNLETCDTCPDCGIRIPSWVVDHQCIKNTTGFYACIDCGKICERTNSKQYRCDYCQEEYIRLQKKMKQRAKRELRKEMDRKRITRLGLSSTET